jgi:tripartite-type tricarboxylate transporter receptor subunit TctC
MRPFILVACVLWAICILGLSDSPLQAQPYPNRPIQVIMPQSPGSGGDILCRILMEELKKILNTEIVVVNKPGASMTLGTDFVIKSKKDGYTLGYISAAGIIAKVIEPEMVPYDPISDLEPLGLHAFFPMAIAVPENAPWKTLNEFVDYAKKNPDKLRVSTTGITSTAHFNMEIIQSLTGARYTLVPYKEIVAASTSMLGGHVEAASSSLNVIIPYAKSGKARILVTSKKMEDFPNVPTMIELGYKQELLSTWTAMYAPARVPEEIKKVLIPAIKKAIDAPDGIAKINKIEGSVVDYKSPEKLKELMIENLKTVSEIAAKIAIRK